MEQDRDHGRHENSFLVVGDEVDDEEEEEDEDATRRAKRIASVGPSDHDEWCCLRFVLQCVLVVVAVG